MKVYQVVNNFGFPASNDSGDLCIFPTKQLANNWIRYVKETAIYGEEFIFTIKERELK